MTRAAGPGPRLGTDIDGEPLRIAVVGATGCGKSTLAATVARRLGLPHVELDGLWWRPGWKHVDADALRARLVELLDDETGWVVDGNYLEEVGFNDVWPRADVLVWLDLPRRVGMRRAVSRTFVRCIKREALWDAGLIQSVGVLSPHSLWSLWRRWPLYGQAIEAAVADGRAAHMRIARLHSDREVEDWIGSLRELTHPPPH